MNGQHALNWLECGHENINAVTDNALFHSSSHINQTLLQIVHILHFCLVDMLPRYFVDNWIRSWLFVT